MVKTLVAGNKEMSSKNLNTPKQGFVQKKKDQKFKQTPTGKITLINGSKNGNMKQQNFSKQKSMSPKKTPEKNNEQQKKNSPKSDKKQSPKNDKKQSPKNDLKKKKTDEEDDTDSEVDINEGIVLEEEKSLVEESGSDLESDGDSDENEVPNIFGTSLADDSDEDDEDFEEDEEEAQVNKGVKMFKGLKSNDKSTDSDKSSAENSMADDSEDDDDEDDDEDDEEVDSDDSDLEEEEDDDEEVEEDDDDDDDDEDEDEESEEEEGNESALGLKALLGNSITEDDDDDEDFVHTEDNDEDDDISDDDDDEEEENSMVESPKRKKKNKTNEDSPLKQLKADKRTIFVGNIPTEVSKKQVEKLFKKFGTIDTIRLRGIVGKEISMSKKVAAKTNSIHPRLKTVYSYIKFAAEKSVEDALSLNGHVFHGNYLKVTKATDPIVPTNTKKSVFVGNLKFTTDENTLRKHFEGCGEVESVRLIKDNKTGIGKGIGYVNFKTEDAAALALELNGTSISDREIRVKPWSIKDKQTKVQGKRSHSAETKQSGSSKKLKNNAAKAVPNNNKEKSTKKKEQKFGGKQNSPQQTSAFQGQKVDKDKKKRKNKLDKKKKYLAEKLTAKTKKPTK